MKTRRVWEFFGWNAIANLCQSTFNPDLWKRIAYSNYRDSSKKNTEITCETSICREIGTAEFKPQYAKRDASIIPLNTIVIQLNDTEKRYTLMRMCWELSRWCRDLIELGILINWKWHQHSEARKKPIPMLFVCCQTWNEDNQIKPTDKFNEGNQIRTIIRIVLR